MSVYENDFITWCNTGDTYKCCCVSYQDKKMCCYEQGGCEDVQRILYWFHKLFLYRNRFRFGMDSNYPNTSNYEIYTQIKENGVLV